MWEFEVKINSVSDTTHNRHHHVLNEVSISLTTRGYLNWYGECMSLSGLTQMC